MAGFLAGLASFLSPCVLPLVPGYLSFVSGVNVARLRTEEAPAAVGRRVALASFAFVSGFSTVFVAMGAAATVLGATLQQHKRELSLVGGVVVVLLGLHMAGLLKVPWLLYQHRAEVKARPLGVLGAYLVGLAFACGWTPCIGPILAAILFYASQQETVGAGVLLLLSYSLGLGVPFLLSALAINAFFAAFTALRAWLHRLEQASGLVLVAMGLLLATNRMTAVAAWLSRFFPGLAALG